MKILFVLEHFYPYIGGVEFLFWQLAKELTSKGHQVKVITTRFDNALPTKEIIEGISIERVNCGNRFAFSYKSIPVILRHANEFDLIHTTTYNAAIPAWVAAFFKRKKCVLTFHEYWGDLWQSLPWLNGMQRIFFRMFERIITWLPFTKIIAVSDFTKERLHEAGVSRERVVRIYNGLDYEALEKRKLDINKQKELSFIFVGRLGVSKGLDILLPAADGFLKRHPEVVFKLVIPKRPEAMYSRIKSIIENLNQGNQIKVMHHLPKADLYHQMQSSSFIVVPSYSEGFCFVAAEACALGIPVVSSTRGALAEVVSGKYVEMDTLSVEALERALEDALANNWIEKPLLKFSLAKSISHHINLYQDVVKE